MITHQSWRPSVVVGWILTFLGLVPAVVWTLDYVDLIRPGERPELWPVVVMLVVLPGVGQMLVKGEGASIGEAFMSWFQSRGGRGE